MTHFLGDHRKSLARIARPRGFDASVQGKYVALKGYIIDHIDNLADFPGAGLDLLHRRNGFGNHLLTGQCLLGGVHRTGGNPLGPGDVLANVLGHLIYGRMRNRQRVGL